MLILANLVVLALAEMRGVRHAPRTTSELSLHGCPEHVNWKDAPFPNALEPEKTSYVYWLRSLFTAEEAMTIVRVLKPVSFSTDADSTDHLPSYELYLLAAGKPVDAWPKNMARLEKARSLVMSRFEKCVTPFLRRKFGCEECVPCISLVRRYKPRERTHVQAHRDALARVTVVVELQPADGSSPQAAAAAGGLFIQKAENSEQSMVPMKAGDAFLHDYELLHGVKLDCKKCTRYSLVVWFREDMERCLSGGDVQAATEMYHRSALAGVADGRYSWARHAIQINFDGHYEIRPNVISKHANADERKRVFSEVVAFLQAAVTEQAHGNSAVFLAELYLEGVPGALEPNATIAEIWRQRAKELETTELIAWEATRGEKLAKASGDGMGRKSGEL